ncbi:MAG TPA: hypothetical protein VFA89_05890 [Terriglobales bacterium]|nr:hypothetical protein [Terriglobales bacterium]
MSKGRRTIWTTRYRIAMAELNQQEIPARVEAARKAMFRRHLELALENPLDHDEPAAIDEALRTLWIHEHQPATSQACSASQIHVTLDISTTPQDAYLVSSELSAEHSHGTLQ